MPAVPLTAPQIELLLILLQINCDVLDHGLKDGFVTTGDKRLMDERTLTIETIRVLEAAK